MSDPIKHAIGALRECADELEGWAARNYTHPDRRDLYPPCGHSLRDVVEMVQRARAAADMLEEDAD